MLKRLAAIALSGVIAVSAAVIARAAESVPYDELLLDYQASEIIGYDEYSANFSVSDGDFSARQEAGPIAQWEIVVPEDSLYNIGFTYIVPKGNKGEVVRKIAINGECPFKECERIVFDKTFADGGEITEDSAGNDVLPEQIEIEKESFKWANGADGYYSAPYCFGLKKGVNTISLTEVSGEVTIKELKVSSASQPIAYKDALSAYKSDGLSEADDFTLFLQAESPDLKSSSTLTAVSDRSSPRLEDAKGKKTDSINTKLNTLGGRFSAGGMWVEYNIDDIPQDGLYKIVFKAKQDATKATTVARKLYINGSVPFKEAEAFEFPYSSDYENVVFGGSDGAYLVPLKKGSNTIRLESTLGTVAKYCRALENELQVLNRIYTRFITVMGTNPDSNRDYDIEDKLPEEVALLGEESRRLFEISKEIEADFGSSNYTSVINTIALQLERMAQDTYTIPQNVASLNSNISSLGGVVNGLQETDLDMDYIMITSGEDDLPRAKANLLERIGFTFKNFIYSFSMDYNALAVGGDYTTDIDVWFLGGREQAQVLKNLVISDFSVAHKTSVTLKLVSVNNTLLQATLAGRGPDVALGINASDTMNYAFRRSLVELSALEGYKEAEKAFPQAALTTVSSGDKVYALPQTMTYPVLFYRADILKDLGISVPHTWEDVYGVLPILAQNNMTFGLPSPSTTNTTFMALLYQRGGSIYSDDLKTAKFYDETTIRVMREWVKFYSSYGLPISYDFVNRFAAGSTPLAIADYSMYNNMCLYAPQMENQWSFTVIPGTKDESGNIDHGASVTVTAAIIFDSTDAVDESWEFLKWWTSADIQSRYGNLIEDQLGKAGRYATANTMALGNLRWSERFYHNLMAQREFTFGVPEVPGGYYTNRYLMNAFMESYNNGTDARETMYEYNITVNEELSYQRNVLELE